MTRACARLLHLVAVTAVVAVVAAAAACTPAPLGGGISCESQQDCRAGSRCDDDGRCVALHDAGLAFVDGGRDDAGSLLQDAGHDAGLLLDGGRQNPGDLEDGGGGYEGGPLPDGSVNDSYPDGGDVDGGDIDGGDIDGGDIDGGDLDGGDLDGGDLDTPLLFAVHPALGRRQRCHYARGSLCSACWAGRSATPRRTASSAPRSEAAGSTSRRSRPCVTRARGSASPSQATVCSSSAAITSSRASLPPEWAPLEEGAVSSGSSETSTGLPPLRHESVSPTGSFTLHPDPIVEGVVGGCVVVVKNRVHVIGAIHAGELYGATLSTDLVTP